MDVKPISVGDVVFLRADDRGDTPMTVYSISEGSDRWLSAVWLDTNKQFQTFSAAKEAFMTEAQAYADRQKRKEEIRQAMTAPTYRKTGDF